MNDKTQASQPESDLTNPQVLFEWKSHARPYKKRSKQVLRFYLALCFLLSVIIYIFGDLILLLPMWASLFIFYVLTITPPPEIENKISIFGVQSDKIILYWRDLHHFYFTQRFGVDVLVLVSNAPYYLHMYIVIPNSNIKKEVKNILSHYLIYQENPKLCISDRIINGFSKLLPEE